MVTLVVNVVSKQTGFNWRNVITENLTWGIFEPINERDDITDIEADPTKLFCSYTRPQKMTKLYCFFKMSHPRTFFIYTRIFQTNNTNLTIGPGLWAASFIYKYKTSTTYSLYENMQCFVLINKWCSWVQSALPTISLYPQCG